jgi:hypothetical protein
LSDINCGSTRSFAAEACGDDNGAFKGDGNVDGTVAVVVINFNMGIFFFARLVILFDDFSGGCCW